MTKNLLCATQDEVLFGGARIRGKSWARMPMHYLMRFRVNGEPITVSVRNKCALSEIVKFISKNKKVPARLIRFESGCYTLLCYSDLYFNS